MEKINWKWIPTLTAVLGLLFLVWKLDDRYLKAEDGQKLEIKIVQTLEKFQDKMDYKTQRDRSESLKDQERQIKIQMKKTPNDPELKEQLDETIIEQKKVQDRIKELEKR